MSKTQIYTSIEFFGGGFHTQYPLTEGFLPTNHPSVWMTRKMPIDNQHKYHFMNQYGGCNGEWANGDYRLKITVHYKYLPNNYGTPNDLIQEYTFKVDMETVPGHNCGAPIHSSFNKPNIKTVVIPDVIRTSSITTKGGGLPDPLIIHASRIIVDNIITSGTNIILRAENDIVIEPQGGIDLPSGSPFSVISEILPGIFNHPSGLSPISTDELKTFCTGSGYKNNQSLKSSATQNRGLSNEIGLVSSYSLHPNPSTSLTTLTIENPSAEQASVRVYDLVGREVYSQDMRDVSASNNTLEISTNGWNTGIYIVKVIHGEVEKSIKLEVR